MRCNRVIIIEGKRKFRFIDLFGGVGGFRLGLERASDGRGFNTETRINKGERIDSLDRSDGKGRWTRSNNYPKFKCVWYCDNDKWATQVYNKRFKENYKPTDIRKVETSEIPDFDMLCGGFPCQAFSIAGKRRGFEDTRGTLFFEIARILEAKRPKIVLLENVKGLLNHDKGRTFRVILETLSELGYDVQWMVLNSKFFGVPQNRERVFIIGNLGGTSRPEILPFGQINEITLEENGGTQEERKRICSTLHSGYNRLQGQGETYIIKNHRNEELRNRGMTAPTINKIQRGGQIPMVMNTLTEATGNRAGSSKEFLRSVDNVRKTTGQIRRLTPKECERLQGFPDNFTLVNCKELGYDRQMSDTRRYKQMGNAVTVNVIEAIGKQMIRSDVTV